MPCRMFERRDVEPTSKTFDGLVLPEVSVTRRTVLSRRRESNVEFERTKLLQRLSQFTGSVLSALPARLPEIPDLGFLSAESAFA